MLAAVLVIGELEGAGPSIGAEEYDEIEFMRKEPAPRWFIRYLLNIGKFSQHYLYGIYATDSGPALHPGDEFGDR